MARKSFVQTAQENIQRDLFEGVEAQFFKGMKVISADPGDIESEVAKALAEIGLCVVVEVTGGPAPVPFDITDWDARVVVVEHPSVNRTENSNGKTADVVMDAVFRRFAQGGHFRPERARQVPLEAGVCWEIDGKTAIRLEDAENGGGEC